MEWIKVKDRLPAIIYLSDGSVTSVLCYQENGFECGSDIQVVNVVWLRKHRDSVTHWMALPEPPASAEGGGDNG